VPVDGGRAALEAIVGPVVAYEVEHAVAASPVLLTVQRARLADLAQRFEVVRPRRSWDERLVDWQACESAAWAAATLPGPKWQAWRDQVQMVAG
jgi:hypothetical protein